LEDIRNSFLDDVFDIHSKIQREDFIKLLSKKQSYLFKPNEIRKKVKDAISTAG